MPRLWREVILAAEAVAGGTAGGPEQDYSRSPNRPGRQTIQRRYGAQRLRVKEEIDGH